MLVMKFLLLLSIFSWSRGEEVKVTNVTQVTGSVVRLFADVPVQATEINWLKNDIKIVDLEKGKDLDFYPFYNIRDRVTADLEEKTFILRDVTPGDSGQYKAVLLVDGKFQNVFFSLRVLDPVCDVSVMTTTVGSSVTLRCLCSSDGAEPSRYEWRNVSHHVSDQQNITIPMKDKPQSLWCVASNDVSNSTAEFTVPEIPDPVCNVSVQVTTVGSSVTLWCLCSLGGAEPSRYEWRNVRHHVSNQQNITVSKKKEPQSLWCVASNDISNSSANYTVPKILDPVCNVSVKNTTVGSNVTLRCLCSSIGAEPSQYKWRNFSHHVSDQQNITAPMKEKPQSLWCVASNEVSNSTATFTVPKIPEVDKKTGVYGSHTFIPAVIVIPIIIVIFIIALRYYKKTPSCFHITAICRRRKDLQIGKDNLAVRGVPSNGACGGSYIVRSDTELLPCPGDS